MQRKKREKYHVKIYCKGCRYCNYYKKLKQDKKIPD